MTSPTERPVAPTPSEFRIGALAAASAAVAFGTAVVATSVQLRSFDPLPAAMWRGVLGAMGLAVVVIIRSRTSRRRPRLRLSFHSCIRLAVLGILAGPVFLFGLNVAVAEVGATVTGFIVGLYSVFAAVLAPFVLKEALEWSALVGLVLALGGTALLASLDLSGRSGFGVVAGVLGALGYSLFMVLGRKWSRAYSLSPDVIALTASMTTGIGFAGWLAIVDPASMLPETLRVDSAMALLWLALVMVGGQTLVMVSARLIDARRSAAFLLLNPITAAVLGVAFLGENLGLVQFIGGLLVLAGMAFGSGLFSLGHRRASLDQGVG